MSFEVLTYTPCGDWMNTWTVTIDGAEVSETFATREEAESALEAFLAAFEACDQDDFRIGKVLHVERHSLEWSGIDIEILYEPRWGKSADDPLSSYEHAHLKIRSIAPAKEPLPITETGFRSHFTMKAMIEDFGGPVAFVEAWLEDEARSPQWKRLAAARRQLSLF